MKCQHCKVAVELLTSVEGQGEWVHTEPGDPPYRFCRFSVAEPDTIGNWAARLLNPMK